jgi:hypothetical protein
VEAGQDQINAVGHSPGAGILDTPHKQLLDTAITQADAHFAQEVVTINTQDTSCAGIGCDRGMDLSNLGLGCFCFDTVVSYGTYILIGLALLVILYLLALFGPALRSK